LPQIQKKPKSGLQVFVENLLNHEGLDKKTLASRLTMEDGKPWSPQLVSKRLQNGKLSVEEIGQIGDAIGAKISFSVTFSDGKTALYSIN